MKIKIKELTVSEINRDGEFKICVENEYNKIDFYINTDDAFLLLSHLQENILKHIKTKCAKQ